MYPSDSTPLREPVQRRRRSDRYLQPEPPVTTEAASSFPSAEPSLTQTQRQRRAERLQQMLNETQRPQATSMDAPQPMPPALTGPQRQQAQQPQGPSGHQQAQNSMRQAPQQTQVQNSMRQPQQPVPQQAQPQQTQAQQARQMQQPQPMPPAMTGTQRQQAPQQVQQLQPQGPSGNQQTYNSMRQPQQQMPQQTQQAQAQQARQMQQPQPMPPAMTGTQRRQAQQLQPQGPSGNQQVHNSMRQPQQQPMQPQVRPVQHTPQQSQPIQGQPMQPQSIPTGMPQWPQQGMHHSQPQPVQMQHSQPQPQVQQPAAPTGMSQWPRQGMHQSQPQPVQMQQPQPMPPAMTGTQRQQAPRQAQQPQGPSGHPQANMRQAAQQGQPMPMIPGATQRHPSGQNGMQPMPPMGATQQLRQAQGGVPRQAVGNTQYQQPQQPGYGWEGAAHPQQGPGQWQQPHPAQGPVPGMQSGDAREEPPVPDTTGVTPRPSLFRRVLARREVRLGAFAVVLLAVLIGGIFIARAAKQEHDLRTYVSAYDTRFCEGVYVDGIHLGGMTQQEGISAVTAKAQQRNNEWYVRLTYQGQTVVEMNAAQLGMQVDVIDALRRAWDQGHESSDVHEREEAMVQLLEEPYYDYTALPTGDTSVVDSVLAELSSRVYRAPKDAAMISFDPSMTNPFTFQIEEAGMMLNTDSLKQRIYEMVENMESGELEIEPETIQPSVTVAELRELYALRADSYTVISSMSTENRNANISRAFELINGTVVKPGGTFSFNDVVGKRSTANGFYPATEYAYGEAVEGIGGGVCQASTTIYLAAVAANMTITKHTPHSMEVNYTSFGMDATVNMDGKLIDFAFKNNTDSNIYIVASVQRDRSIDKSHDIARVRIYGPSLGQGVSYKLVAEEIELIPRETEYHKDTKGEYAEHVTYTDEEYVVKEGRDGHVTQSYSVKYQNGKEVERTALFTDTYKQSPRVIYTGAIERWDY